MGNAQSAQRLRPPEESLNPLIAARAAQSAAVATRSGSSSQQQPSQPADPPPSFPALWGHALLCYWIAHRASNANQQPSEQQAQLTPLRWHLVALVFFSTVIRFWPAKDEVDSSVSLDGVKGTIRGRRGSSKYRGLSWHKGVGKWAVQLRINGQASAPPLPIHAWSQHAIS